MCKYRGEQYSDDYLSTDNVYRNEIGHFLDVLERFRRAESPVFCDIGCSVGIGLREAAGRGYRGIGVELSAHAAARARADSGCPVLELDVAELSPAQVPLVDVFYLNHVLEHFVDPAATLRQLRCLSKPESLLWINVPNVYSLQRRLLARLGKTSSLALGEHFCYFSWQALDRLLGTVGYRVIWRESIFFAWHWKLLPVQAAGRLAGTPDGLALVARRVN